MKSVWQETALPQFPQFDGDVKTDVLVIGGGIAGILTAYFLHQSGIKYMRLFLLLRWSSVWACHVLPKARNSLTISRYFCYIILEPSNVQD